MIDLKPVNKDDYRFLYQLLKERPNHANISHVRMPRYDEHLIFCRSNPYFAWYTIRDGARKIGSIYLTSAREIGIFIRKEHWGKGYAKAAIKKLMTTHPCKRYLANIAPGNESSKILFKKFGFKQIQETYELRNE